MSGAIGKVHQDRVRHVCCHDCLGMTATARADDMMVGKTIATQEREGCRSVHQLPRCEGEGNAAAGFPG